MMLAPVVVFACGNPSRGDDALGPLLLDRLQAWLMIEGMSRQFELIGDFQLQVEHALDLSGRHLALFIDAGSGTRVPFTFSRTAAGGNTSHTTHAISPEAVLAVLPRVRNEAPPPAFVLCVRGERFELGEGLCASAQTNADAAFRLLQLLCRRPAVEVWTSLASSPHPISW